MRFSGIDFADKDLNSVVEELSKGSLPLHSVEDKLKEYGNKDGKGDMQYESAYVLAAGEVRRKFLEKTYLIKLDATRDTSFKELPPHMFANNEGQFSPKITSYLGGGVGGRPISVVGPIRVGIEFTDAFEDRIERKFYIPLRPTRYGVVEGTSAGLKMINDSGSEIRIKAERKSRVTRSPVLEIKEGKEEVVRRIAEDLYPDIEKVANDLMKEYSGRLREIQTHSEGNYLWLNFVYEMYGDYYGHEAVTSTTRALLFGTNYNYGKKVFDGVLKEIPEASFRMIAGGWDGDLRPGEKNIRGRKVEAEVVIPNNILEAKFKGAKPPDIVELDNIKYMGNKHLGTLSYAGMGPEVLEAVFNAFELPTPPYVSSTMRVGPHKIRKGELNFKVDFSNMETGCNLEESPTSLIGKEMRNICTNKVMGHAHMDSILIASVVASAVLGAEFNQYRQMYLGKLGSESYRKK